MHTSSILPFVAMTTVSLAAQPPVPGAGGHVDYLSTFDDLEAPSLVATPQLPGGIVGPYNGLDMQLGTSNTFLTLP